MGFAKILVTGGCGFIGSHYVKLALQQHAGASVVNVDKLTYAGRKENVLDLEKNPQYTFVHADICDYDAMLQVTRGCDAIVHFAAESHVDNSFSSSMEFTRTNTLGTHCLMEACRFLGVQSFDWMFPDFRMARSRRQPRKSDTM